MTRPALTQCVIYSLTRPTTALPALAPACRCVLFMTSAYILFLNPLILSGASSSFSTGMPATDVALATSIATALGTLIMGVIGERLLPCALRLFFVTPCAPL